MKISEPVKKETRFVCGFTLVCCVFVIAVYLCVGWFSLRSLIAVAVGGMIGSLNFFLMALTVQKAVDDDDAATAKRRMQASQSMRTALLFACLIVAVILLGTEDLRPIAALLVPLLFPRIAMTVRGLRLSKEEAAQSKNDKKEGGDDPS